MSTGVPYATLLSLCSLASCLLIDFRGWGMQGYARATNTTVPRPSPKGLQFSASQTIGRYGNYANFDLMFGGDGQPEDPHDPSYSYADLFAAPGDMCVDVGVLAELSRADEEASAILATCGSDMRYRPARIPTPCFAGKTQKEKIDLPSHTSDD